MLDPASGLLRVARDEFKLIAARVEAGALPANHLRVGKDELEIALRQAELAQTRAELIRQIKRMAAAETYQLCAVQSPCSRRRASWSQTRNPQGPDSLIGLLEFQQTRCVLLSTSAAE